MISCANPARAISGGTAHIRDTYDVVTKVFMTATLTPPDYRLMSAA